MKLFKVEHYLRDHPEGRFPAYESLSVNEASLLRTRLCQCFGLPVQSKPLELALRIRDQGVAVPGVNATDPDFRPLDVLTSLGIRPREQVYVNWYRFDDLDRLRLANLDEHFDDIWYPSSDDIDLFDDSFTWLLSISHEGFVKFVSLEATCFGGVGLTTEAGK